MGCRISFELKQLRGFLLVGVVALPPERNFAIIDDFNTVAFGVDKNKDMLIMDQETRLTDLTVSENDFIELMVLTETIRVYHNENMVEEKPNFLDPDEVWRFGVTTGFHSQVKIVDL